MRKIPLKKSPFGWLLIAATLILSALPGRGQSLSGTFNSASDVLAASSSYTASGTANITLNFAPVAGTTLTVVNNTGQAFIGGSFVNLAQGQVVPLIYHGVTYSFVANYYGGTGNDLVLQWAGTQAFAWGNNLLGQLGIGGTTNSVLPVPVDSSTDSALYGKTVIDVSAGGNFSVALSSDGTVAAWGDNGSGELGNSGTSPSLVPVAVDSSTDSALFGKTIIGVSAGEIFGLALCSDGSVASWGDNTSGELGDSGVESSGSTPIAVASGSGSALFGKTAIAISAGSDFALAICSDGSVVAWGDNSLGQLGDGGVEPSSNVPMPLTSSTTSPLLNQTVIAISAGTDHSLALTSGGILAAWGDNSAGELGDNGAEASSNTPVLVDTSTTGALFGKAVKAIAAGNDFSLALCSDGSVVAWGTNSVGQLGNGGTNNSLVAVAVDSSTDSALSGKTVIAIAAGDDFGVAYCSDGSVATWGGNGSGELGNSGTSGSLVPVKVDLSNLTALQKVIAVASGPAATTGFALVAAQNPPQIEVQEPAGTNLTSGTSSVDFGTYVVGGSNHLTFTVANIGQTALTNLGITIAGSNPSQFSATILTSTTVASGTSETFTVTFAPTTSGPLSATLEVTSDDPVTPSFDVALTGTGTAISTTYTSGTDVPVTSNGYNATGLTLPPIVLDFAPPVGTTLTVVNNTGISFITGTFNGLGQGQVVPLDFGGVTYDFVANYYGGTGNDLVLEWANTQVFAWGDNSAGELGNSGTVGSLVPEAVNSSSTSALFGKTVIAVAAGDKFSLALSSDGTVAAWGDNSFAELGNSGTNESLVPVAVTGSSGTGLYGKTVVAISAGTDHSLALCSDGSVAAWGYGFDGELGTGSGASSLWPVTVSSNPSSALNGKTVVAVSAGGFHSLALCSDGSVAAWGYNIYGQLGNSGTTKSVLPVAVTSSSGSALFGKTVVAISAGGGHSLALCSDGSVAAWGYNVYGQLGNSSTTSSLIPVAVTSSSGSVLFGKTVVGISAGSDHSLARCSDGTVVAWGHNVVGQLGNNTNFDSSVPVAVSITGVLAGGTATEVSAGLFDSLALTSNGAAESWGWNYFGELGDGEGAVLSSAVPVAVDMSNLPEGDIFVDVADGPAAYHSLALVAAPASGQPLLYTVTPVAGAHGSISPSTAQTVASGSSVTFAATPASGYVINQWLVNGNVVQTTGTVCSLTDITSNDNVQVTFTAGQLTPFPGTYNGLFSGAAGSDSLYVTIKLSANGNFTGKLFIDNIQSNLKGQFDFKGAWHGTVGGNTLSMQLGGGDSPTEGGHLIGVMVNANAITAWHTEAQPVTEAGKFTHQIVPAYVATGIPTTSGTATLTINKNGSAQLAGTLPDGQKFSTATAVVGGPAGDQCLIYAIITYKNVPSSSDRGYLIGAITFPAGVETGPLRWIKPTQTKGAFTHNFDTTLIISARQ